MNLARIPWNKVGKAGAALSVLVFSACAHTEQSKDVRTVTVAHDGCTLEDFVVTTNAAGEVITHQQLRVSNKIRNCIDAEQSAKRAEVAFELATNFMTGLESTTNDPKLYAQYAETFLNLMNAGIPALTDAMEAKLVEKGLTVQLLKTIVAENQNGGLRFKVTDVKPDGTVIMRARHGRNDTSRIRQRHAAPPKGS